MPRKPRHLTIAEKRDFFTMIARDKSGEFSTADKFKAIVEDTKLFQLEHDLAAAQAKREEEEKALQRQQAISWPAHLLEHLPPPLNHHAPESDHPPALSR